MILIIWSEQHQGAQVVMDRLPLGTYRDVNIDNLPDEDTSLFEFDGERIVNEIGGDELEQIEAIYYSPHLFPVLPGSNMPEYYENFINRELLATFLGQLMCLRNVRWMNHPFYSHLASFKILQLSQARHIGFNIPKTRISTSPKALFEFFDGTKALGHGVITKAVHQGYVQAVDPVDDEEVYTQPVAIDSASDMESGVPLLFQEQLESEYELRVIVVGSNVFCVQIQTKENYIDVRKVPVKDKRLDSYTLPNAIVQMCIQLVKSNRLSYGAIDLIFATGRYYFLELNPLGHWKEYAEHANYDVSGAIVTYLQNN